jgi:hypothetical protein
MLDIDGRSYLVCSGGFRKLLSSHPEEWDRECWNILKGDQNQLVVKGIKEEAATAKRDAERGLAFRTC